MLIGDFLHLSRHMLGDIELLEHWTQGEFHHDLVFRVSNWEQRLPGEFVLVSTNCNGGIKEVMSLESKPSRFGLWRHRCPDNEEFDGELPAILAEERTIHWFHPCDLLAEDARSEIKPEYRTRQKGGGWKLADHDKVS